MEAYVGIDVSKRWLNLALVIDDKLVEEFQIDYNQSEIENIVKAFEILAPERELLFGCEATGQYHKPLVYQLYELGYKVKVFNPRMTYHEKMAYNELTGTDAIEAVVLAKRIYLRNDRFWKPEHEGNPRLRILLVRRKHTKKMLNMEKNQIERYSKNKTAMALVKMSIESIEKQLEILDEEIKELVRADEDIKDNMKLLQSIPGVGYYSALTFLSKIKDVSRFKTANELVKYLGLAPMIKVSGSSIRKGKLSKTGDSLYRATLYLAAVGQTHRDTVFGRYYEKLRNRGKSGKTSVVAIMRKMTRIMFAVLRDRRPFSMEVYGNPRIALET